MNHQSEEHFHTSHDVITNQTRSKMRFVKDVSSPSPNQVLTLATTYHVLVMNTIQYFSLIEKRYEHQKVY